MNSVIMMGRLTKDPEIRYSNGENSTAIANYRLAVDRRFKRDGQQDADFFNCVVFGRGAEFAEKYFRQGTKIVIQGRIQNDNYKNSDGNMVYRDQIVVENQEFAESKAAAAEHAAKGTEKAPANAAAPVDDGFMNIPDGDEELPFA